MKTRNYCFLILISTVIISCSNSSGQKTADQTKARQIEVDCTACSIIFRETNAGIVEALRRSDAGEKRLLLLGDTAGTESDGFKTGPWKFEDMSVFHYGGKTIFLASGLLPGSGHIGVLYLYRIDLKHGTLSEVKIHYPDFKQLLKKGESLGASQALKFEDGRVAGAIAIYHSEGGKSSSGGEIDVRYHIGKTPDGEFTMYPFSIKIRRRNQ